MKEPTNHVLYRFYNARDELLYIGITGDPMSRYRNHSRDKSWFSEVTKSTMTHYETHGKLVEAERTAIQNEQPRHNKAHSVISPQPEIVVKTRSRPRGSIFGSHASSFPKPDAITSDQASPIEEELLHEQRRQQQMANLLEQLSAERRYAAQQ